MTTDVRITGAGGEYMDSVIVVEWRVNVGDVVQAGDTIAVVETAKAASEIEAPCDGTLSEVLAEVGAEIGVGDVLGRIESREPAKADDSASREEPSDAGAPVAEPPAAPQRTAAPARRRPRSGRMVASPLARRIAERQGVDLSRVDGTGPGGRIKRRDVERALRDSPGADVREPPATTPSTAPSTAPSGAAASASLNVWRGSPGGTETVVFLHGFGADLSIWHGLMPGLDRSIASVAIELPGHGASPRLDGMISVEAIAEAVARTLRAQRLEDCHFVGHSLGGAVLLALGSQQAITPRSLALLAPAGLGPEVDMAFLAGYTRASCLASLRPWLERLVADPAALPAGYAEAVMRRRADAELRRYQAELAQALFPDGTQAFRAGPVLEGFAGPAKIIWGASDRIFPVAHASGLPGNVALHRLPRTGHMPHLERPGLVARLVNELVRAAARPGSDAPAGPEHREETPP